MKKIIVSLRAKRSNLLRDCFVALLLAMTPITAAHADIKDGLVWQQSANGPQEFDGVKDRMVTTFNPATNQNKDFTISFWANPTKVAASFYYSVKNSNAQRFYLRIQDATHNGTISFGLSSWNPSFNAAVNADRWQHYVVKLEGTTATIYRNDKIIATQSGIALNLPSGNLVIGSDELSTSNSFYPGKIEDFRIYNRALLEDEIQVLYDLGGGEARTRDNIVPSVATNLIATALSSSQIKLTWSASTDNVGVKGYRIYRDGKEIKSGGSFPYTDSSLAAQTTYTYTVAAEDADGNLSAQSEEASAATPAIIMGKTLSVVKYGTGQGTVTATGIDCGADCTELFVANTTVTLTQSAAEGHIFAGWRKGTCLNSSLPGTCKIQMTSDQTMVAMFGRVASRNGKVLTAASCELSDVQGAINQAGDGDTVEIPSSADMPGGTCTWPYTNMVDANNPMRSLVIKGAGIDQTIIYDDVPTVNTRGALWDIRIPSGAAFRLTGFTFKTGPNTTAKYGGVVSLSGHSQSFRVDHIRFNTTQGLGVSTDGCLYGVIDNNIFEDGVNQSGRFYHSGCGSDTGWGDVSMAEPLSLGTYKAIFMEDNTVRNRVMTDAYGGARYVVRFNTIGGSGIPVQNHGLDSSGRIRGALQWEVYNNKNVKLASSTPFFHMRSGNGVIFNNSMTASTWVTTLGTLNNYRSSEDYRPWRTCDGVGPFDLNELDSDGSPKVYESGTHTGSTIAANSGVVEKATVDNQNKNWQINQWLGYSLRRIKATDLTLSDVDIPSLRATLKVSTPSLNAVIVSELGGPVDGATDQGIIDALNRLIHKPDFYTKSDHKLILPVDIQILKQKAVNASLSTQNLIRLNIGLLNATYYSIKGSWGSKISANTANTITVVSSANNSTIHRRLETGDLFEITKAKACMDQVGRSQGVLITGGEASPTPIGWVNQQLTPIFLWGNELNGVANNKASGTSYVIRKGKEFYEDNNSDTVKCSTGTYDQYGICTGSYTAQYTDDDGTVKDWTYKPYVYPHFLRTHGLTADDPNAPPLPQLGSGDVSGDGKVTMYDAALVLRFTLGSSLTDTQKTAADKNGDGKIDGTDVVAIAKKALGL